MVEQGVGGSLISSSAFAPPTSGELLLDKLDVTQIALRAPVPTCQTCSLPRPVLVGALVRGESVLLCLVCLIEEAGLELPEVP